MFLRRSSVILLSLLSATALAQSPRTLTTEDYAKAERWMNYNLGGLVMHSISGVEFLPDGRVFYRETAPEGTLYMLADPKTGEKVAAFDNQKMETALRAATQRMFEAKRLGIMGYALDPSGFTITTAVGRYHCDEAVTSCTLVAEPGGRPRRNSQPMQPADPSKPVVPPPARARRAPSDTSPDKKYAAFIRDWNLWVRNTATGEEKQLTTDGVKDYGYSTDNAGWTHSDAPIVVWSADSKQIATFQQDQRKTGEMYLVPVTNRHPQLEVQKYPLAGDKNITMIERVIIDVDAAKVTRLKMPPDQHRSTICDDVSCRGGSGWDDVQFAPDGKTLAFVSTSRDHKDEWLRVANTETGEVHDVYHEHADHFFDGGTGKVNWHYLPATNEFLWFSERDNWGQMYLYDLASGKLKNQITHGEGNVTQVLRVDEKARMIYFLGVGKEKGRDPYFVHYYRVGFDGKGLKLLTPEDANHAITLAPDGKTFTDIYSTIQTPATAVLRDDTGKVLVTFGKQDITALLATGWKPPTRITVMGRDGKTPIYGMMWKPTYFDEKQKYPIVDWVYPGPVDKSCPAQNFSASSRDSQSLAELGFIVVCLDGMGTEYRSKSFHTAYATPEMFGDGTIPDQVAGIKGLASKSPWIDLDRVGIYGHSGGGYATASAMFHFPDFFKVGISESGNHDNRVYEDDWAEKFAGLEVVGPDGKSNYDAQANENFAKNLKGHLLLAHGTMDDNVPMNNTLLVVDALIKANKDFDLIMFPNAHHGYAEASQYMMRRRWDYFVRYLQGNIPPENYQVKPYIEVQRAAFLNGPSEDEDVQPDDAIE